MSMRHFLMSLTMLGVLGVVAAPALSVERGCAGCAVSGVAAAPYQTSAAPAGLRNRSSGCCWGDSYAPWESGMTYPFWVFGSPKQSYYQRPSYQNPAFGYYYSGSQRSNPTYRPAP
jgi:hypothetical protein